MGSNAKPAGATGQISGDLTLKGGGAIELSAEKTIRLRVGKTVITIGPDQVEIEADKITLAAKGAVKHDLGEWADRLDTAPLVRISV